MINPIANLFSPWRSHTYYTEMVQLTTLVVVGGISFSIYQFGNDALAWAEAHEGMYWLLALVTGLVLAQVVLLYFRLLMLKYSRKDKSSGWGGGAPGSALKLPLILGIFLWLTACSPAADKQASSDQNNTGMDHANHGSSMRTMQAYGYADSINDGLIAEDTLKGSPRRAAMATIAGCHVHMDYGSPGVKGRVIWGGLIANDQVWAAGAHNATTITFNKPLVVNEKEIAPGTYAFFIKPGTDKWVILLNSKSDQHLADEYNPSEDVLTFEVIPEEHAMTPRLTYLVSSSAEQEGLLQFFWETKSVAIPFKVKG